MRKIFIILVLGIITALFVFAVLRIPYEQQDHEEPDGSAPTYHSLASYSIPALKERTFVQSNITLGSEIERTESYRSHLFYFMTGESRVSGVAYVPGERGAYPVIVLLRGYVDREAYSPGTGSRRIGQYLASGGYIALAPDFLGYEESDDTPADALEARFATYTTVLQLVASIEGLQDALTTAEMPEIGVDSEKIGLWAHSNGGQIAQVLLAATGKMYPTVMWAPVTKPFPYSILYYSDEAVDEGKALRKLIADFEANHDASEYSPNSYREWIAAPLQVNHGEADGIVPVAWTDSFVREMETLELDVEYFTYPGVDHNFSGPLWNDVAANTLRFFDEQLSKDQSPEE